MNAIQSYKLINLSTQELLEMNDAIDQAIIIVITDAKGTILGVNDRFCQISKYEAKEIVGKNIKLFNYGTHAKSFFKSIWKKVTSGENWNGDVCNKAKDGTIFWLNTTIVPCLNEAGKPYKYISIHTDITSTKKITHLNDREYFDMLTGLRNRRALHSDIEHLMTKADTPFSVILFDINRFKMINDSLGYNAGDRVLIEIAKRLASIECDNSTYYRLTSDKFICLYASTELVHEQIKNIMHLFDSPFHIDDVDFYLNITAGVSLYPEHSKQHEQLIKYAEIAMHQIKKQNTHSYMIYVPEQNNPFKNDLIMEARLQAAIRNEAFELHYQPKIDIRNGSLIGMEALIRWNDKELGQVRPDVFIPIAEECGLIDKIGEWVTIQAGKQVKEWNEKFGLSLKVAINISPKHIARFDFIEKLIRQIEENQLDTSMLEIEITELSFLDQTSVLIDKIHTLKQIGITISIDDFGMGYSSLSYLKNFPIDALKIDRYFIKNLCEEKEAEAMVSAIISLAHALNLDVVAEGVENEIELNILKKHRCEYVQGYFFSKPLSVVDFEQKLISGL